MFYRHLILKVNNEDVLYLYLNNYQEFSNEFKLKSKSETLYSKVKDYLNNRKIQFNGKKVMFVVNGLIIGSLMLATSNFNEINNNEIKPFSYSNINNDYIIEETNKTQSNIDTLQLKDSNKNNYTIIYNTKKEIEQESPTKSKLSNTVLIKNKKGKLESIVFDHYLTTIIAMKIPPTYNDEALKAMAVLLRTNAFKEIYETKYLSNDNNLYQDINILKNNWQNKFNDYYRKIHQIVRETNNQYLAYHNYFLNTTPTKISNSYTIGISNYGANLMAKAGYNYIDILQHYYPDSTVVTL